MTVFSGNWVSRVIVLGLALSAYLFALTTRTQAEAFTSSKPFEDLPAHYILLIDQSGSIAKIPQYKEEIARLLSERIPDLITHPAESGIALPPYRLGKDYLSVVFFGIPESDRNFGKLLHPAVIFWCDKEQFQILSQRIYQQSFDRYFSAISVTLPLSLPLVRESLSNPGVLANRKVANTDLRFCRTVGIILTDAMYNVEKSSLDELSYLSRYGEVEGMEEARMKIQEVRRYYDYDVNFWTFFNEGRTKRFLVAIREFVPKTVALSSLLAKVSDVSLARFAPTSKELYYKGKIKLNFLFPDQSPFCYYLPHELRWKRRGELDYHIIDLSDERLQAEQQF